MSNSDAQRLEQLKLAYDAIIDGMTAGRTTVEYRYRNVLHRVDEPHKVLPVLGAEIERLEQKVARASSTTGPYRVVSLGKTSRRGT